MSDTLQAGTTARDFDFFMAAGRVADDCGRTWETNWVMDFTPAEGGPE